MTVYKVVDLQTRTILREYLNRKLAYRFAHKKDSEYGAVKHAVLFCEENFLAESLDNEQRES